MRGTRIRGLSNALALARPFNRRVHFKSATKGAVLPGQRSLIGCGELRARTRLVRCGAHRLPAWRVSSLFGTSVTHSPEQTNRNVTATLTNAKAALLHVPQKECIKKESIWRRKYVLANGTTSAHERCCSKFLRQVAPTSIKKIWNVARRIHGSLPINEILFS